MLKYNASLTSIHDQIPSDFRLPVVPGGLEALGKADAEILEVAFAYQGLRGAGGDQCALNGQDHGWAGIKIYAVVGLAEGQGEGLPRPQVRVKYMEKEPTSMCSEKAELAGNTSFYNTVYRVMWF